jgi:hypothetical protein
MIYNARDHAAPNSPPNMVMWSNMGEGVMAKFADSLITLGLILLGLVLMVTPLALWVAWTDTILFVVLAAGVSAGALYCVLVHFEKPAHPGQGEPAGHVRAKTLPDKIIAELQELHPFIHHHRSSGGPKFQIAMDHLRKRLYRGPG